MAGSLKTQLILNEKAISGQIFDRYCFLNKHNIYATTVLPLILVPQVWAAERSRIFLCVSTDLTDRQAACCYYRLQTKLRENKIKIIYLNINQRLKMSEDHTYCKDPGRLYRNLKKKFDVVSVNQDELNNDIPYSGSVMQGEDKLYLT